MRSLGGGRNYDLNEEKSIKIGQETGSKVKLNGEWQCIAGGDQIQIFTCLIDDGKNEKEIDGKVPFISSFKL